VGTLTCYKVTASLAEASANISGRGWAIFISRRTHSMQAVGSYVQWLFMKYANNPLTVGLAVSVVLLACRALSPSELGWRQRLIAATIAICGGAAWWKM
jgi:hypothetical protein